MTMFCFVLFPTLKMFIIWASSSQPLLSLSHLGQILSYLCPPGTENLFFINLRLRSQKRWENSRTLVFSARPADVVSCVTTNCADIRSYEVFRLKCVKLEEFKDGYSIDLLFSSPETLENPVEKHYECLSNLSENIFWDRYWWNALRGFLVSCFSFFNFLQITSKNL